MTDKVEEKTEKSETTDFEKRYNDSQEHITKIEAENKDLREAERKDKELFEQVSPYVDWDAINGTKTVDSGDDDGYVDKRTLNETVKDLREQIKRNEVTQGFRTKYPDMVEYEDLVSVYVGKTDPRRSPEERIEKAVENVKALLESERAKGREGHEAASKEKTAKEAEVGGLAADTVPVVEKDDTKGETFDEYMAGRQKGVAIARGYIKE